MIEKKVDKRIENEYFRARQKRKESARRFNGVLVIAITAIIVTVFSGMTISLKAKDRAKTKELTVKQEELQAEQDRTQELEKLRVHVQSKQYIEEEAKKMGYAYPNQIVFEPESDN